MSSSLPTPTSKELMDATVAMAREAGKITLKWFKNPSLDVEVKGDGSPVTAADRAAERYVREQIALIAPDSSIIGEEEGSSVGTSDLTWYIDPLDGTKAFTRGVPLYATLLAVNDAQGPAVGVIYIPATEEIVWAGRGLGAWTDDGPARVSDRSSLKGAYASTSSVSRWGADVYQRFDAAGVDVRGWGDGYGFLMAATGRVDAMIDIFPTGSHPWDFAPVPVIMTEAGGHYSALDGSDSIHQPSGIASNGLLHEELLALIRG